MMVEAKDEGTARKDRLLAIIPARGGSKRLPRKNLLKLGGKPLITWTIDAAIESGCFVDVLVSTDDQEIADIAKSQGALVPWLRPKELATDTATSIDVLLHSLDWYERERGKVDGVMLLQPTSPFRSVETIQDAAARFQNAGSDKPIVSVCQASSHPAWTFSIEGDRMIPYCGWNAMKLQSQDLAPVFALNGAIYVSTPCRIRETRSLFAEDMGSIIMKPGKENIDIDTEDDWMKAERIITITNTKK